MAPFTDINEQWLAQTLGLDPNHIESVSVTPLVAGGTPMPKYGIVVKLKDRKEIHLFAKMGFSYELNAKRETPYPAETVSVICKAARREASFYSFLTNNYDKMIEEQGGKDELFSRLTPRCYHAEEAIILLDNPISSGEYETLSTWTPSDSLPDLSENVLKGAVIQLAQLHAWKWGEELEKSDSTNEDWRMDVEDLIASRKTRLEAAGVKDKSSLKAVLLKAFEFFDCELAADTRECIRICTEAGMEKLLRCTHNVTGKGALCHGDSNPGNLLVRKVDALPGPSILLIDFQEPQFGGTAANDLARLFVSSVSAETRAKFQDDVLDCYIERFNYCVTHRPSGALEDQLDPILVRESVLLASVADAVFIIGVLPVSLWGKPEFQLFSGLVRRSMHVLRDLSGQFVSVSSKYCLRS